MSKPLSPDLHNLKVVESNELVRASYKLSKRCLIFIYYLVAKLDSIHHDAFTDFVLRYEQIVAILNFDGKRRISKRKEVFSIMDELNHAPIYRENEENAVQVNRLSSVTHHKATDEFRLRLDPALRPHLLQLRQHFTEFFYRYILPMNLSASIRLYGLLKSYHSGKGVIEKIFSIEDLKFRLWLQGKYQKFYEFKRWVLLPALDELKKFTDLQADFAIHEKIGKRVEKIKFQIRPNQPALVTPQSFLEKTPPTPVTDSLSSTEVYQQLIVAWVSMTEKALSIVKKSLADEDYHVIVTDTVKRCEQHFKSNPSIKNRGGFVLKAIQDDYYQAERIEEERQTQIVAQAQYEKDLKKEVATLVEEGRKEFEERRAPKLKEIKSEYLTDEIVQEAIAEYAPGKLVYRKILDNFLAGKKSKLVQKRTDDYLADKYLDKEYINLDRFLAKNYSLEKVDGEYTLSV